MVCLGMTEPENRTQPKWLTPVAYLVALPIVSLLILLRDEPWTKGSLAGLVIAACMGVGVAYLSLKIALKVPGSEPRSPDTLTSKNWLDLGWGIVAQLAAIGCAGATIALFF